MPWTKLIHECRPPRPQEVEQFGAQLGSEWECDEVGCNQVWTLDSAPRSTQGRPPLIKYATWKAIAPAAHTPARVTVDRHALEEPF